MYLRACAKARSDSDRRSISSKYPLSMSLRSILGKMRVAESHVYASTPLPMEVPPWKAEKRVSGTGWQREKMVTVGYGASHTNPPEKTCSLGRANTEKTQAISLYAETLGPSGAQTLQAFCWVPRSLGHWSFLEIFLGL